MLINNFGYENNNKQKIASEKCESLRKSRGDVVASSFYGHNFKVREPWYCGGSIDTNCKTDSLYGKDLDIIINFNVKNLEEFLSDLSYLKELAEKRIADISKTEGIIELKVNRYKEGNKKLCKIFISTHDVLTDGYFDSKIINKHIIEEYIISDTLKSQMEIDEKIKELEEKYNVKCS